MLYVAVHEMISRSNFLSSYFISLFGSCRLIYHAADIT